jgi:diguanylate cyclase (GGDEF)-like protein
MFNISKNILKQALDISPVATVIVDLQGSVQRVAYVNQAFEALSGFDSGELIGHPWQQLLADEDEQEACSDQIAELQCHPRLGASDCLSVELLPLFDRPGTPRYLVGTERQMLEPELLGDDTDREALLAVLRDARMHLRRLDGRDSATGILSRHAFDDLLQRDWVLARREQRSLGLMLFQLDGFDAYREVYGRHAADSCLRKVAHAITGSLRRAADLTARFQDDQFVVLISQGDESKIADLAAAIAGKVRGLSVHHPRSPVDRFVTVSFGVAVGIPASTGSVNVLVEQAEESLTQSQPISADGISLL